MSVRIEELARSAKAQAARRASPRSIGQRDPSLRWPHLYDLLRAKGYSKEKAARIANSRLRFRKKGRLEGLPYKQADSPRALARVRKEYESKRKSRTASALVAACYSAACRPPTSGGTGGSLPKGSASATALSQASKAKAAGMRGGASSNTSAYPADTFKATRPSDSHPPAPGANDRTAVRGHKGVHGTDPERRIPRAGETVDIYRDLGHGREHKRGFPDGAAFSVRHASAMDGSKMGLVVASTTGIILANGRPSWAHSAKRDAEKEGKRGVHGFIRGEVVEYRNPVQLARDVQGSEWQKVTYYPGTQDFFHPVTRQRFVGSDQVALVNGEFFAKGAKFIEQTTPISPIEARLQGVRASAEFACHSKECAPPPVGKGGSSKGWAKAPWGDQWDKGDYSIHRSGGIGLGASHTVFHVGTEKSDDYRATVRGKPAKKLGVVSKLAEAKALADKHAEELEQS